MSHILLIDCNLLATGTLTLNLLEMVLTDLSAPQMTR